MNKYNAYTAALKEASKDGKSKGIEAHGVKGMKSTPWRKKFKSQEDFEKWLDKNGDDVEVQGTRDLDESVNLDEAADQAKIAKLRQLAEDIMSIQLKAQDCGCDDAVGKLMEARQLIIKKMHGK